MNEEELYADTMPDYAADEGDDYGIDLDCGFDPFVGSYTWDC